MHTATRSNHPTRCAATAGEEKGSCPLFPPYDVGLSTSTRVPGGIRVQSRT